MIISLCSRHIRTDCWRCQLIAAGEVGCVCPGGDPDVADLAAQLGALAGGGGGQFLMVFKNVPLIIISMLTKYYAGYHPLCMYSDGHSKCDCPALIVKVVISLRDCDQRIGC